MLWIGVKVKSLKARKALPVCEMGACMPAKTSKRKPPLECVDTCSLSVRAVLAELPAAMFGRDGVFRCCWQRLGQYACGRMREAVRVYRAECCRQRECTVRRSGRDSLRTVSCAIGRMLGGAMCLLAAFNSANMAVVGFAQSVLKSAADLFALVRCCPIVTVFSLPLSVPLFSGRLGFVRLRGYAFSRSRWVMRPLGELRCRRLSAGLGAEHEQRVCFHAAMREFMECIVHGPLALQ